jgi:hypothetical protein
MAALYSRSVFLNVPFDRDYRPMFHAIVFAVFDCGFVARCAWESADGSQVRLEKIYELIGDCRYGVHDISRTDLDAKTGLPRFNMPLELGVFLGAKRYGKGHQREKICLILDRERHRYQRFCSDIAGQDIEAHAGEPAQAIRPVRDWLSNATSSRRSLIPGGAEIARRYAAFGELLPVLCRRRKLEPAELTFNDFAALAVEWQRSNRW